ncbi:MAG: hypothetical protein KDK53_22005 [Maritimibacter sp.]|nr:hypothetical protein [Maritimibacter sp.]
MNKNEKHILDRSRTTGLAAVVTGTWHRIDRFRRDEDAASQSVEALLIIPLLIWTFLASYTFFDVYRAKSLALKANYAISDLLSRETETIDMNYLLGAEKVYDYLTQQEADPWVRVTVVYCWDKCTAAQEDIRVLKADWSKATDGLPTFSDADVMSHLDPIVPLLAEGERVIIVETSTEYTPPFSQNLTGIGSRTFVDIVMTRPRFAPQLCWDGIGCGA